VAWKEVHLGNWLKTATEIKILMFLFKNLCDAENSQILKNYREKTWVPPKVDKESDFVLICRGRRTCF